MVELGSFKRGNAVYPLPAQSANTLLRDADPALYYVIDYFQSVLKTYMGQRLVVECAKDPPIGITLTTPYVVPYDPSPYLQEQQFMFLLLAVYRKKDKYLQKGLGLIDDEQEWGVDYIMPPLTGAQVERIGPVLRSVGVILHNRIENMGDPYYMNGAPVWELAGLEMIRLDEGAYGQLAGTGNLTFPAWRGKLIVKENDSVVPGDAGLSDLRGIDTEIDNKNEDGTVIYVETVISNFSTSDFYSGFTMQVAKFPVTVPLSNVSPNDVSETEGTGTFFPGSFFLQVSGTFSATYLLEGSVDGINWIDISPRLVNVNTGSAVTTLTAAGLYQCTASTPPLVRIRCTAYTSGTPFMTISGIV